LAADEKRRSDDMTVIWETTRKLGVAPIILTAAAWLLCAGAVGATELNIQLTDTAGVAVKDAVVYAEPTDARQPASAPKGVIIDQVNKEFLPRVSVIQTGAAVGFPNKDNIRHHVYSFSPAKTFELKLYHGVPAQPVVFDKPGIVVLGCNIHDKMLAYVLVVDTPYFTKTDDNGRARLDALAPGEYDVKAWQPQSNRVSLVAAQRVRLAAGSGEAAAVKLKLTVAPAVAK
jgi:plastocyanin